MPVRKVNIDRLPSNDRENRRPPKFEPVTMAHHKQPGLAEDIRNIGNSLFETLLMPTFKSMIVDFLTNSIQMIVFRSNPMFGPVTPRPPHRSYNKMYGGRQTRQPAVHRGSPYDRQQVYEDIFFDNREEAQLVLGRLMERVAEYGWATVGDLYSLSGLQTNYTQEQHGWSNLYGVRIIPTSDGYLIDLPEPQYLR